MSEPAYRCERCGAPLEVSPETIVAICPYCGYPNHISGTLSVEEVWIVPSKERGEILRAFEERTRRDVDMRMIAKDLDVFDVEGYYAPYWVGEVPVKGYVEYYKWVTERRGKQTVRRKKHYREAFSRILTLPISARRQVAEFGVREVVRRYLDSGPEEKRLAELGQEEWERMRIPVLNTELDREEASRILRDDACDETRAHYASKADGIEFFNCSAGGPERLRLVLLPLWTVYYRYKNAVYRVVFSGWDAEDVAATEPVTIIRRIFYMGGAVLGSVIASAGFLPGSIDVAVGGLVIGVLLSYASARALLRGARIERGV